MKILATVIVLFLFSSCASVQQSLTIAIPNTPRTIVGRDGKVEQDRGDGLTFRPDLTRVWIENQAGPDYVPRVWLLRGGKRILLVGVTKKGPPQVLDWQIQEFSLPPGINQIIVERGRYIEGKWQMIAPEFLTFKVAKLRRGWGGWYGGGWGVDNNRDCLVIIRQNCSFIYEGGRTGWYGHGRWGW